MKKLLLITFLLFFTLSISAQINYQPGYFIDNEGKHTSCLIRNVDWKSNPTSFEFKLTENTNPKRASIKTIKEFTITDEVRYERHTIKINRSSDDTDNLENDRGIVFKEEQLFLKVLVEGEAMLYYYEDKNLRRFFLNPQNSHLDLLVYKRYRKSATEIGENTQFKQQLWNHLKCNNITSNEINKISYKKEALIKLFRRYNFCVNPDWTPKKKEKRKIDLNFSIRPGVNFSSVKLNNGAEFDAKTNLRLGMEIEVVLPFYKNKWAILIEPTYRNYQSEAPYFYQYVDNPPRVEGNYSSIEFAIGARHYLFINDNSKLFLTAYLLNDLEMDAKLDNPRLPSSKLVINPLSNAALGLGYKYNNKVSLEFRYDFDRELLRHYSLKSDFSNISLILGYTFL
jgi:hypothetical protein